MNDATMHMDPAHPTDDNRLAWGNDALSMIFDVDPASPVRLTGLAGRGMAAAVDLALDG